MLLAIIGIAALLLTLSVYLFKKVEEEDSRSLISMEELDEIPSDNPPVIVKQMKGGKVQQTLCYFLPGEVTPKAVVAEVDVRDRLFSKLRPDNTITITH
ncbi:MAG: hypothetical protein WA960_07630 [Tunicatimonas sp.]